jgi:hypothetical protein
MMSVDPRAAPGRRLTCWFLAAALMLVLGLFGIRRLAQAVTTAREVARYSQCVGNLTQIGYALRNYESACGSFPPAYTTDVHGRPLLSWRVLILPYLELGSLYQQFHRDEPWDSPHNASLLDQMPPTFACPTQQPDAYRTWRGRFTNVLALSAPGTALPGNRSVRLDQVTDGPDNTLWLIESTQADVPWTAPVDLDPRTGRLTNWPDASPPGPISAHPGGRINACTVEDHVHGFGATRLRRLLVPASTIAGGEALDLDDLTRSRSGGEAAP